MNQNKDYDQFMWWMLDHRYEEDPQGALTAANKIKPNWKTLSEIERFCFMDALEAIDKIQKK